MDGDGWKKEMFKLLLKFQISVCKVGILKSLLVDKVRVRKKTYPSLSYWNETH